MEKSTSQIEKNVSASFGYVKKDMLMLNDAFSDLNDKIQHLSLNHATLLDEIGRLKKEIEVISGKKSKQSKKKVTKKKHSQKKKAVKKTASLKKTTPVKKKIMKNIEKKKPEENPDKKVIKKVVKETVTYE